MRRRLPGVTLGLGLGSLAPALLLLWVAGQDPAFADHLPSLLLTVFLPVQLLGALLGGALAPQGRAVLAVGGVALLGAALATLEIARAPEALAPVEPALLVVAIPSVSWAEVERAPMSAVLGLAREGAWATLPAMEGGLDDWITLDSGISTQGRPWTGERPTADRLQVARIWEVAAHEGLSVGLLGWPVTAPARPPAAGGFLIAPGLAPSAWPQSAQAMPDLVRALLDADDTTPAPVPAILDVLPLGLRWSTLRDGALHVLKRRLSPEDLDPVLDRPLIRARLERDVFLSLLRSERPDLAGLVLSAPAQASPLARGFALAQADGLLAELVGALGPRTRVVVVSDRGWMVARGWRIPAGRVLGRRELVDVAPTLLGLLDLPAARDQRGELLLGGPAQRIDTWDALAPSPPEGEHRRAAAAEALRALSYWE